MRTEASSAAATRTAARRQPLALRQHHPAHPREWRLTSLHRSRSRIQRTHEKRSEREQVVEEQIGLGDEEARRRSAARRAPSRTNGHRIQSGTRSARMPASAQTKPTPKSQYWTCRVTTSALPIDMERGGVEDRDERRDTTSRAAFVKKLHIELAEPVDRLRLREPRTTRRPTSTDPRGELPRKNPTSRSAGGGDADRQPPDAPRPPERRSRASGASAGVVARRPEQRHGDDEGHPEHDRRARRARRR